MSPTDWVISAMIARDFVTSAFQVNDGQTTGRNVFSGADGSLLNAIVGNPGELSGLRYRLAGDDSDGYQ
jgi:hypothetical protein